MIEMHPHDLAALKGWCDVSLEALERVRELRNRIAAGEVPDTYHVEEELAEILGDLAASDEMRAIMRLAEQPPALADDDPQDDKP